MPKVMDPPRFGLAFEMPLRPGPLVSDAPAHSESMPRAATPAPRATPPARNDRRPNACDMANPPRSALQTNPGCHVGDAGGRLHRAHRLRVPGGNVATLLKSNRTAEETT